MSALFVAPIIAMVAGSLRGAGLPPPRTLELLPREPGFAGYAEAFEIAPLGRALFNSALLAGVAVPLAVLVASLTGFGIAQLGRRSRTAALVATLLVATVPATALAVPRFVGFRLLGLEDTWVPLLAPALLGGNPLLVLLCYLATRRLPAGVVDAARVEGAGILRTWWTVVFPLTRSTVIAVALLAFAFSWGNLLDALLYVHDEDAITAPLAVRSIEQLGPSAYPAILASATVVAVPVLLAFAIALHALKPRPG